MSKLNLKLGTIFCSLIAIMNIPVADAQTGGPAVEQWKSFLPYNRVNGVAHDGSTFYCATTSGFFTYDRTDGTMSPYSKANGMSDIGLSGIAYDNTSGYAVLAYTNSNIDLFKDQTFYNLPELKLSQISGDKTIHNVIAANGKAYLSTGVGLLILNLTKREVKETVVFYEENLTAAVYATAIEGNGIYAATSVGLFRTELNNPFIQNYATWLKLNDKTYHYLANVNGTVYSAEADSVFTLSGTTLSFFEKTKYLVSHLDEGIGGAWISTTDTAASRGYSILVKADKSRMDSIATIAPSQVLQLANGDVYFTDNSPYNFIDNHGLRKKISVDRSEPFFPEGPITDASFDISAYNGDLWVAHGGKDEIWNGLKNRAMFSEYREGSWRNQAWVSDYEWVQDFIRVLKDQNTGTLYAASFSGGLLERPADGNFKVYNDGYLKSYIGNPGIYQLSGIALDGSGNLWMTNFGAPNELVVKTSDGKWYDAKGIPENSTHTAADVLIDDAGQKWFIAPGNGAVVYNDNGTVESSADDQYRVLRKGEGAGNLPENVTSCIVKDKEGAIWIGTTNGIGIVECPDLVISRQCEATLKVIQEDEFAGHLFENQYVRAIAVDGANRKWVGTTNGVWLLSDDARKTIYRFTEDNSPLPSNYIQRINIDPVTGDVYFSTNKGIASFRSTATEGTAENADPLFIYPNPVPSGFNGMIAVRGVAENADVRFTDISGQMVYRTKALGGQAVWNGKDYTGHKVQSGVYLVFVVNKDGTQKATSKFIIHQ
jgi:hypothetical protein